jgi:hypothetical protein
MSARIPAETSFKLHYNVSDRGSDCGATVVGSITDALSTAAFVMGETRLEAKAKPSVTLLCLEA